MSGPIALLLASSVRVAEFLGSTRNVQYVKEARWYLILLCSYLNSELTIMMRLMLTVNMHCTTKNAVTHVASLVESLVAN